MGPGFFYEIIGVYFHEGIEGNQSVRVSHFSKTNHRYLRMLD
jgi:hypothetical protein